MRQCAVGYAILAGHSTAGCRLYCSYGSDESDHLSLVDGLSLQNVLLVRRPIAWILFCRRASAYDTIRYDTIAEFNVDSKAEYSVFI